MIERDAVIESLDRMNKELRQLLKQEEWKDRRAAEAMTLLAKTRALLDKEEEK